MLAGPIGRGVFLREAVAYVGFNAPFITRTRRLDMEKYWVALTKAAVTEGMDPMGFTSHCGRYVSSCSCVAHEH